MTLRQMLKLHTKAEERYDLFRRIRELNNALRNIYRSHSPEESVWVSAWTGEGGEDELFGVCIDVDIAEQALIAQRDKRKKRLERLLK